MNLRARNRTLAALLFVFAVQMTLLACSNSASPTATPVTSTPNASPFATVARPTATTTVAPPVDLERGGVLRFAVKEVPPHQDVHQSVSSVLSTWGAGIAYSRLFKFQRGPGVPMPSRIPECDLCVSWEQTGSLEFVFQIRDDAFWPDVFPTEGRAVTASDVVFSYRRQMTESWPNAELLSNIAELADAGDNRVRIRLKAPDAEFFEKLANGRSVIVAREVLHYNGDLFDGPTLGSGPWLVDNISVSDASFTANPDYYGDDLPHVDGLQVQFIAADSTRAAGVRAGLLDMAETTLEEAQSAIDRFPGLQTLPVTRPGSGVEVALNTSRAPLDSADVRKALLLAWDIDSAMPSIWGEGVSPSVGLNLPYPAWSADFNEQYGQMFGDMAAANELLNGAGLTPSDRIAITVGEFGESAETDRYIETAGSLAAALNALGVAVTVNSVPTRLFADNVWLRGDYDIFVGAPPPVDSLSGQLFGIYHSEGPWNTTGYSTPELDALIEKQAVEWDVAERGRLLLEIQDEIMAGSHRFYPVIGVSHWLWQPGVQDIYPDTSGASGDFLTKVWLKR